MTTSRLRKAAAALLATGGLFAAGLTAAAPAEASNGHGHAWGHFKGHCRAVHATGVGTFDTATGEFMATSEGVTGTGAYASGPAG
jgi:hypothetical protein